MLRLLLLFLCAFEGQSTIIIYIYWYMRILFSFYEKWNVDEAFWNAIFFSQSKRLEINPLWLYIESCENDALIFVAGISNALRATLFCAICCNGTVFITRRCIINTRKYTIFIIRGVLESSSVKIQRYCSSEFVHLYTAAYTECNSKKNLFSLDYFESCH